jgi:hypothetical protein
MLASLEFNSPPTARSGKLQSSKVKPGFKEVGGLADTG